MDGLRHRITVLYGEESALKGAKTTEKGVLVKPQGVLAVQHRWIYAIDTDAKGTRRITWKSGLGRNRTVIDTDYAPGMNIYSNSRSALDLFGEKGIYTSYYKMLHFDEWKNLDEILPAAKQLKFKWKPELCDYDILIHDNTVQVVEYCSPNKKMKFKKDAQKTEIGLLYVDNADQEDVNLSGLRCIWKEDSDDLGKCEKTTLFYKPAHHFPKDANVSIEQVLPVGLHPKINIDLTEHENIPNCKYFVYNTLPRTLFVDKFQTENSIVFGIDDLEAPEYNLKSSGWGSEALIGLEEGKVNEITYHSRYLKPGETAGAETTTFEPTVFMACESTDDVEFNPFYMRNMGYEAMFTANTVFHHLNSTKVNVDIPYPDQSNNEIIEKLTFSVVLVAILYLVSKILKFSKVKNEKGVKRD